MAFKPRVLQKQKKRKKILQVYKESCEKLNTALKLIKK